MACLPIDPVPTKEHRQWSCLPSPDPIGSSKRTARDPDYGLSGKGEKNLSGELPLRNCSPSLLQDTGGLPTHLGR